MFRFTDYSAARLTAGSSGPVSQPALQSNLRDRLIEPRVPGHHQFSVYQRSHLDFPANDQRRGKAASTPGKSQRRPTTHISPESCSPCGCMVVSSTKLKLFLILHPRWCADLHVLLQPLLLSSKLICIVLSLKKDQG